MAEDPRLYVTTVGLVVAAVAYTFVGRQVGQRRVIGPARFANDAFRVWWFGLAMATGTYAVRNLLALSGYEAMPVHLTLLQLLVFSNSVALAGLVVYLLYLFTGRQAVLGPVIAIYFAYYIFYTWLLFYTEPVGLIVGPVRTALEYAGPNAPMLVGALVALFYVPQFLAAIVYGSLYWRLSDPLRKRRVALVAGSIILWSAANMVLPAASESAHYNVEFVAQMLVLGAPFGAVVAYRSAPAAGRPGTAPG